MTPKEKAKELVDKFYQLFPLQSEVITSIGELTWEYDNWKQAKQCALIAVDEIIANIEPSVSMDVIEARIKYWQEVKQEIEKI
jgi:hypothetical protein